ncbi:Reticulon-like protein B9 [Zostera marina]|uniref:Reticulon-like protein n=1 Tax=Zostera marina TaxID=29655 RepID=A0A0K9Q2U8_ZOSMR|nr:Reticulon-like protein B9 [Zostera marina]
MPIYDSSSSDSDDEHDHHFTQKKLFGRERPLHSILGGGRVADVLLWRDTRLSGGILAGVTILWLLFEVAEYNFLTLACHLSITAMLIAFIWSNLALLFDREPPRIPELILTERSMKDLAHVFHGKLSRLLTILFDIARGKDLKTFLLAIGSLWIISVVGGSVNAGNLFYFGFVSLQTSFALYERYESEIDNAVTNGTKHLNKLYRKFDKKVLNKIPRGPVNGGKKFK